MDAIAGLLFVGAIVLFIMSIVSVFKKNGKAKRRALIGVACIVVGVIAIQFTSSGSEARKEAAKETAAKEQAEAKKEQAEKQAAKLKAAEADKKKKAKEEAAQKKFAESVTKIQDASNGIVHGIKLEKDENVFLGKVYISEAAWAASNESEKSSASVSLANSVKNAAIQAGISDKKSNIFIDFYSFENGDIIASENTFKSGFDIKR